MIRTHGDYHLGQTMLADRGWVILDFEGEPARPMSQRRLKRSPLRDVAGMLRSFSYAAAGVRHPARPPPPEGWEERARETFLDGYFETVDAGAAAARRQATRKLLSIFELEKAVYELRYELNNRPDWVAIPVGGHRPAARDRRRRITRDVDERSTRARPPGRPSRPTAGSSSATVRPGGQDGHGLRRRQGRSVELKPADTDGLFEGVVEGAELPLDYQLEVDYGDGGDVPHRGPVPLHADARRARPAPASARAATRRSTPASART